MMNLAELVPAATARVDYELLQRGGQYHGKRVLFVAALVEAAMDCDDADREVRWNELVLTFCP